jgi:hypothetical protein
MGDVPVIVGGIIPDADAVTLRAAGVAEVFTPKDYDLTVVMGRIVDGDPPGERARPSARLGESPPFLKPVLAGGWPVSVMACVGHNTRQPVAPPRFEPTRDRHQQTREDRHDRAGPGP